MPWPMYRTIALSSLMLVTLAITAKADPAYLCVDNTLGNAPVKVEISSVADRYQGPGVGYHQTAAVGRMIKFDMGRDSSVSGSVGTVCLKFTPGDDKGNDSQCFRIHGGNGIEKLGFDHNPNPYSGKMEAVKGCWVITTVMPDSKHVQIGKPEGEWVRGCGGGQNCKATIARSLDIGTMKEASWNAEVRSSVSVAVEAGAEAAGVSAKTTVTASLEAAYGEAASIARSKSNGFSDSCEQEFDMVKFNIYRVWQWQVTTPVDGSTVTIKTCTVTCTPDDIKPGYLPGEPSALKACKTM